MLVAHYNRVMPKASLSVGTLQALVGQRDNKLFEAMQAVCCTSSAEPIYPPGPLLVPTAVHSHVTLHQSRATSGRFAGLTLHNHNQKQQLLFVTGPDDPTLPCTELHVHYYCVSLASIRRSSQLAWPALP